MVAHLERSQILVLTLKTFIGLTMYLLEFAPLDFIVSLQRITSADIVLDRNSSGGILVTSNDNPKKLPV